MKKIFAVLSLLLVVSTSCDDDLDIVNPNQATVEVYWQTADHAVQGVNAVYSTLHRGGISRWMPFYYIIRSDEGKSISPATDIVNNMDIFLITDYNFWGSGDVWRDNYIGVFRANQVITFVPEIEMDETLKARVVGEAKFLRGMFYYHLVTLWGSIPLTLTPSTPNDKPATSTAAEVLAQIETDLNDAVTSLPTSYTNPTDLGRATKGAAQALLAKVLMQQGKYDQALTPLEWLVKGEGSSIYDLMPDYRDNFLINTENNRESVFEWQFQLNPGENHDDDTDPRADALNYGTSLAQFFGPSGIGWSDGEANRWVVDEFLQEPTATGERDPRLEASFLFDFTDEDGPSETMIYGQTFEQRYGVDNKRVWFRKFQNDHWKDFEGYNSPNNWRYIRYSDVLLMYAESLNAMGNTADAYQYVDRVRQRAGLTSLTVAKPGLSQDQFLEQLKHERLLELSGEGHRWNDLARWGDLGPELADRDPGFSNFVIGKHELLPIPQLDLDFNPSLEQNPNW
jgi:starch-binding outer membrane protein, SusD/RagB family